MDRSELQAMSSIEDPIERAQELTRVLAEQQEVVEEASKLRRMAIAEALDAGVKQDVIAKAVGVTPGRVSQINKGRGPVVTGWLADDQAASPEHRIAICGSRASGTNDEAIAEAIRSLGAWLTRCRCRVTHGPLGVGIEVMTYIADRYRPPGLGAVTGIFGHSNVIRDAEYVLVIGGGKGTQDEVDLAFAANKKLVPMPASGGTASQAYTSMHRDEGLRAWMPDEAFTALADADATAFAQIVDQLVSAKSGANA